MKRCLCAYIIVVGFSAATSAYENFSVNYDETDPGTHITRSSTQVTWTDLSRNESAHVSDSKGPNYFSGDFEHKFICQYSNADSGAIVLPWAMANNQNDWVSIYNASSDALGFMIFNNAGTVVMRIYSMYGGNQAQDEYSGVSASTDYYITVIRDDDGGVTTTSTTIDIDNVAPTVDPIQRCMGTISKC